jgi:hypothetical protein
MKIIRIPLILAATVALACSQAPTAPTPAVQARLGVSCINNGNNSNNPPATTNNCLNNNNNNNNNNNSNHNNNNNPPTTATN